MKKLLLAGLVLFGVNVLAQDRDTLLLGGVSADLQQAPYLDYAPTAFIYTGNGACTGVLVSSNKVLTAAHCLTDGSFVKDYGVIVGGVSYSIETYYYNAKFDTNADVLESSKYDLGILILKGNANIKPAKILYEDIVASRETATIFGYGSNEKPSTQVLSVTDLSKYGDITIGYADKYIFSTNSNISGVTVCSGDSGAPVIQISSYKDYLESFVMGIVSSGTNKNYSTGECYSPNNGASIFVNLLSPESQAFLRNFNDIQYTSGYKTITRVKLLEITDSLNKLLERKNLQSIKDATRKFKEKYRSLLKLYTSKLANSSQRVTMLNKCLNSIDNIVKSNNLALSKKEIRNLIKANDRIVNLAISKY